MRFRWEIWCLLVAMLFGNSGAVVAESDQSASDAATTGWRDLFDGKSLDGWQSTGDATWEVAGGEIRTAGGKPGFLMTNREFADFVLQVEFRAAADTNSGVFLRSVLEPTDPTKDCYELNIAPRENPFPTGSLVARLKSPGILAISDSTQFRLNAPKPLRVWDGQWHSFEVRAVGGKFAVSCDGDLVLEYNDPTPIGRGHIGLQSNQGAVAFRGVRIHELPR